MVALSGGAPLVPPNARLPSSAGGHNSLVLPGFRVLASSLSPLRVTSFCDERDVALPGEEVAAHTLWRGSAGSQPAGQGGTDSRWQTVARGYRRVAG